MALSVLKGLKKYIPLECGVMVMVRAVVCKKKLWFLYFFMLEPLAEGMDISLLENIVSVQRGILSQVYNVTDVSTIPQLWTLYSKWQSYG